MRLRIRTGLLQVGRFTVYFSRHGIAVFDDNGDLRWERSL